MKLLKISTHRIKILLLSQNSYVLLCKTKCQQKKTNKRFNENENINKTNKPKIKIIVLLSPFS